MLEEESIPLVSVVMSVYNCVDGIAATLESLLAQEGPSFEVVVIDDGSTDGTGDVLRTYAGRDHRIKVITQANTGLTGALIVSCAAARGAFIARQDADDVSVPGRLQVQSDYLLAHRDAVLVASSVRFLAPDGEWLFDRAPPARIQISLDAPLINVPPLVGTMFRRDAYQRCGGFQKEFVVAQDVDLWLRLEEQGPCHGIPDVLYETRLTVGGISSRRRDEQLRMCALGVECARERRRKQSERPLLDAIVARPVRRSKLTGIERARFYYFVAACLHRRDRSAARRYYRLALKSNPLHFKALLRMMISWHNLRF